MLWQRAVMGVVVTARAPAAFVAAMDSWNSLDRTDCADARSGDLEITLDHCGELPASAEFDHQVPPLSMSVGVDHLCLADGPRAYGRLDHATGRAHVHAVPGAEWEAVTNVLRGLLSATLARAGRHRLHGGAVVVQDRGVVISGPSGAGKSTTSVLLARADCELLADDSVFTDCDAVVRGLRERPRVSAAGPAEPGPGLRIYPDGKVEPAGVTVVDRAVPAGLLVFLDAQVPSPRLLAPGDALVRLLRGAFLPGAVTSDRPRLHALRALAATAPAVAVPARTCPSPGDLVGWMEGGLA